MAAQIVNKRMLFIERLFKNAKFRPVSLRTFLSDAYLCEEAWHSRLNSPLLKDLNMNMHFLETDKKFQTKRLASGVDIDMFANNVSEQVQLDELEHLLYRFRGTKRSPEILDSTHHATVKAFLKFKEFDSLFRILRDRLDYGIFPDAYSYNLLMDTFCKQKKYRDAAEIAVLMMLQEDFSNPISRILGIYSCHMFLTECQLESFHPKPDDEITSESLEKQSEQNEEEEEDEEEGEDQYIRVPYLRNPWYDDHFDIKDPKALIGKTLYLIGREEKNPLGWSCQLIGLGMQNKFEKAASLLDNMLQISSARLFEDEVTKFKSMLAEIEDTNENKTKWLQDFENKFSKLQSECKLCPGSIANGVQEATKLIPALESSDIEKQKELFVQWEKNRNDAYEKELQAIAKENKIKEIAKLKEELFWKEKFVFFYEKEDKIMSELGKVEEIIESLREKTVAADVYVPPLIMKKTSKLSKLKRLAMIKKL